LFFGDGTHGDGRCVDHKDQVDGAEGASHFGAAHLEGGVCKEDSYGQQEEAKDDVSGDTAQG